MKSGDVKVPYTFILHVLDSKLDEIDKITPPVDPEKYREFVDNKLGDIENFWETNYREIQKFLEPRLCDYLKEETVRHIYRRKVSTQSTGLDVSGIVKLYIARDWDKQRFDELENSVLLEKAASERFA